MEEHLAVKELDVSLRSCLTPTNRVVGGLVFEIVSTVPENKQEKDIWGLNVKLESVNS